MKKKKLLLICPEDKEYKMFLHYDKVIKGGIISPFQLMVDALRGQSWPLVDLKATRDAIAQDFRYLLLYKRYESLRLYSKNTLSYDENGFHLDGHVFETLDEVEKALRLKSFL